MNKSILILDMDGTLCTLFDPSGRFDVPINPDFFATRQPIEKVINYTNKFYNHYSQPSLFSDSNSAEVWVQTMSPDEQCDEAKINWLTHYLPLVPTEIGCYRSSVGKVQGIFNLIQSAIKTSSTNDNLMIEVVDDTPEILLNLDRMLNLYGLFDLDNVLITLNHISNFVDM